MLGPLEQLPTARPRNEYPQPVPKKLPYPSSFCEGYFSYKEGIGEADNPYQFGTEDYWAWRRGWYLAKTPWYKSSNVIPSIAYIVIGLLIMVATYFVNVSPWIYGLIIALTGVTSLVGSAVSGREIRLPTIVLPRFSKGKGKIDDKCKICRPD